jgi:hypothetical protein
MFISMIVLILMTAACQSFERKDFATHFPLTSPFKTFINQQLMFHQMSRSEHNEAVCLPKVFQTTGRDTSGDSITYYADGNMTRTATHFMSKATGSDFWYVYLYHPDSHSLDTYVFNTTYCDHQKFKEDYPNICLPSTVQLDSTFTIGLGSQAIKAKLWVDGKTGDDGSMAEYLLTANENMLLFIKFNGKETLCQYYYDSSLSVDPNAFVIPSYCK